MARVNAGVIWLSRRRGAIPDGDDVIPTLDIYYQGLSRVQQGLSTPSTNRLWTQPEKGRHDHQSDLIHHCDRRLPSRHWMRGAGKSSHLTSTQLQSQAAAICTPVDRTINSAVRKVFAAPKLDPKKFAGVVQSTVIPQFQQQIDGLAALHPSADLEAGYRSYLSSARELLATLKANPAAPVTENENKVFGPSNAKARGVGLPASCLAGQGPTRG